MRLPQHGPGLTRRQGGPAAAGRLLTSLLILAGAATAAPAPRYSPPAPTVPSEGVWELTWASLKTAATFRGDGSYGGSWGGRPWYGSWAWDGKTRTMHISETPDGVSWSNWSVELAESEPGLLTGVAEFGENKTSVSVRRVGRVNRFTRK